MTTNGSPGRSPRQVWAEWKAADESGDADRAGGLAEEMLDLAPDHFWAWFEAGLLSKARRDWPRAVERNRRAVELFGPAEAEELGGENPAAWNLGIAATAVGDWAQARRAWTAYGLGGLADGTGPIDADLGLVPIRLNPERPGLPHQRLFDVGETEVVWCWRRSPAHAVIASVPLPESGHRFRDVLLHDGVPAGTRRLGDREVSVFEELERLEESGLPTWQARVSGLREGDADHLTALLGTQGLGIDEWSGIRMLCADCSHGSPAGGHEHAPLRADETRFGLAGPDAEVRHAVEEWQRARPHVAVRELARVW